MEINKGGVGSIGKGVWEDFAEGGTVELVCTGVFSQRRTTRSFGVRRRACIMGGT